MISLIVTLLLVAVVIYVVNLILGMIALPPAVKQIAYIILGLVVLFWLLDFFHLYTLPR